MTQDRNRVGTGTGSRGIVGYLLMAVIGLSAALEFAPAGAAITPAQRKELASIRSDAGKAAGLINKKKFDEAEAALKGVEQRLETLVQEAMLEATDPALAPVKKVIEQQRANLAKKSGGAEPPAAEMGVSFVKDVAPILSKKCGSCHDDKASGGLRLDTFAGMEKGGRSGPLAIAGRPQASLLMQRLMIPNPQLRMPKNAEALTPAEVQTIGTWIGAGAKFDGDDKATELSRLRPVKAGGAPAAIVMATGDEKISFIRDVAPTLVNTCGGCHNDNRRDGGLSLVTFEKLMQGGDTSLAIKGGSLEESRLWRLVNADEEPVMPQGQARITRKWHGDLKTWILEGAKFDGNDPKRPLRQMIPSDEQMQAEALAKLSPAEWKTKRLTESQEQWKRVFSKDAEPTLVETDDFIVLGDVSEARLKDVGDWATEYAAKLREMFDVKDQPLFKGRLAIFVMKERFGYEEFNNTIHRREVPREVTGHSHVTSGLEEAFVAVQDMGDVVSEDSPGLHGSVLEHVTGAFLKRAGDGLPDWLVRGAGLALTGGRNGPAGAYVSSLQGDAGAILRNAKLMSPEDLFQNGTFAPGDVGAIGFTLVDFLLKQGGPANFGRLVARLQAGDKIETAIQTVYRTDCRVLAAAYANTLGPGSRKGGKK